MKVDDMKLEEGIYDIPDNCTAVYANRQVIIKQKRPSEKSEGTTNEYYYEQTEQ